MKAAGSLAAWHPFTQEALDPAPIPIARGEGAYLYTREGRKILDAISSWWVNIHGHSHPRIAAAIAEQARRLEHVIFAGFTHEPAEELCRRLSKILPAGLEHIFFSDDGSTAVEVALKMALQYWANRGRPEKRRIVALEHAYHGDTAGAMSAGADSGFVEAFEAMRFPVYRAPSAYCYRCPVGKQRETCRIECLEPLQRLLEQRHEEIAALIAEPLLQGAGGMIVHPAEFLRGLRELTERYQVLLIADEVLTGFGRCGRMFACELAGISPDILCVSKGLTGGFLPLAATAATGAVHETFCAPDRRRTFFHGHSYTANPLGCAAAIASLEVFETEPVFERIAAIEKVHRERTAELRGHPAVGEVRMIGTIAAIELQDDNPGYFSGVRSYLYDFYLQRGVLLRPLGNVVYILPPYVVSPGELHWVYDIIGESLEGLPKARTRSGQA